MPNTRKLLSILRELEFDASLAQIAGSFARLDELDDAIDWALSRDPTRFPTFGDGFYIWRTDDLSAAFPKLLILYKYDATAEQVTLISVKQLP